jgi:MFS transporter, LPLT family, lysophospholipid transporter
VLVLGMNFLRDIEPTIPFMILLGGLGGFLVVPMNALLQHRGHNLMGAGRSIAVQNFNEQACILLLGGMYSGLTHSGLSAYGAITAFGLFVAVTMALIGLWHRNNVARYPEELARLHAIARQDSH